MIETHAHVYDAQFDEDRSKMIRRAVDVGVEEIWMPNCDGSTIEVMLRAEEEYPICKPMMGLHPCYVNENVTEQLQLVEDWLSKRPFIMIGEIGLDFYWDLTFVEQQEAAFTAQLELAKAYNLPICIHSRNSKDNEKNALLRCCELIEEAQRVLSLSFLLGIGGVSTFKNGGMDKVLPYVSLNDIVLETDSPYLAPTPNRGKRNEVSYLDLVANQISLLTATDKNEIINQTTLNAKKLIGTY
jgi:TatD DNase family protein